MKEMPTETVPLKVDAMAKPWEMPSYKTEPFISTTIKQVDSREKSNTCKKALAMAMLDENYPQESWTHVYTDGSAKDAIKDGGAGVHIRLIIRVLRCI